MRTLHREDGFTLVELMMATSITLVVLAVAMSTFKNALTLNDTATLVSDSNQNLRAGTNMLVRDLMQTGRGVPIGGVPIPSGTGATALKRPSPTDTQLYFNNTTETMLPAIVSGYQLGPTLNGEETDIVTMLMIDPTSYVAFPVGSTSPLTANPAPAAGLTTPYPTLAADGSSLTAGQFTTWITDAVNGIKVGDVLLFTNSLGSAIQTVTRIASNTVYFEPNDVFNFNQRSVLQGSIMQIRNTSGMSPANVFSATQVVRLHILTYYVDDATTDHAPRLTRRINHFTPQALAGVVEDLNLTYDLFDGDTNPVQITSLPHTIGALQLNGSQVRKVNVHVGVRSESKSTLNGDYLRHHATTVVSLRGLAARDTYQ